MGARRRGADEAQVARLQGALGDSGLDGLLVMAPSSRDPDLAPFVGPAHLGESFLLVPRQGRATLAFLVDMERDEAAATGIDLLGPDELALPALRGEALEPGELWFRLLTNATGALGLSPGSLAAAGHLAAGTVVEACTRMAAAGWAWRSGSELLRRWRKHKPARWQDRIAGPADGVCAAMRAVAGMLAAAKEAESGLEVDGKPLTIGRLRRAVSVELACRGLSQPESNIMAAGRAAGVPHSRGESSHVLASGEPLIVDLFPQGELFADCTRTFCVGEPPADFVAAHSLVRQALEQAHRAARPGARGWELQAATCDLFEGAGYPTLRSDPATRRGYVHGLGHGVGYELHEYPSFRQHAGAEGVLEIGDLFTLEPGLYDVDAGYGVRLEDLCYLGNGGVENLTPLPLDWDPRAWAEASAGPS